MSEVADAVQVIMLAGRGAFLIGNLSLKAAMLTLKVLTAIYMAKWNGRVSFDRLRRMRGDDFQFINASSEDPAVLRGIEEELKAHGILFARLPDLCGGDGRTQYVVPTTDMGKFKAFMLDHKVGRYGDVKVGPISASDYAFSGHDSKMKPTQEMEKLFLSAQEDAPRAENIPEGCLQIEGNKRLILNVAELPALFQKMPALQRREKEFMHADRMTWIQSCPYKAHEKWAMYELEDGIHSVIVPKEDIKLDFASDFHGISGAGRMSRFAIYDRQDYIVVNMKTGEQTLSRGNHIRERLKPGSPTEQGIKLRNLERNLAGIKNIPSFIPEMELTEPSW